MLPASSTYLTLSGLAGKIRSVLNEAFTRQTYWVVADVMDHKYYAQKATHYFCLAEKDTATHSLKAKLSAVAWSGAGADAIALFESRTGQAFRADIQVLVSVSVSYHPAYGLQLVLNDIDPAFTMGLLARQRAQTLEDLLRLCPDYIQLAGDRYITRNNRLRHAPVIQHVAVISSGNAAGYKDFRDTLERNGHGYHIRLTDYFVAVQGEANAAAVCSRLVDIYQSGVAYDAVVIIRGGGSQADLLIFDQFVLARAVAKFPIPIITGIGHQINETIVDLMAHTPVKTPSIAAAFILSHNRAFEESVLRLQSRIIIRGQQRLAVARQDLSSLKLRTAGSSRQAVQQQQLLLQETIQRLPVTPGIILSKKINELAGLSLRLKTGTIKYLSGKKESLSRYESICRMMDPEALLQRGFARIYRAGRPVTRAQELQAADTIDIQLAGGMINAIVQSTKTSHGTEPNL